MPFAFAAMMSAGASPISEIGVSGAIRCSRARGLDRTARPGRPVFGRLAEGAVAKVVVPARRAPAFSSRSWSGCRSPAPAGFRAAAIRPATRARRGRFCPAGRARSGCRRSCARSIIAGIARLISGGSTPGVQQHHRQDVRIQHALHRDALRGGLDAGHVAHGIHQRLAVVRAGAAHQRAVDIEEDQRRAAFSSPSAPTPGRSRSAEI